MSYSIFSEFERLGLAYEESPYQGLAFGPGGEQDFLAHLRRLGPGATWRDVFPDMPAHWVLGRPETWTEVYEPLGAFDYPHPPAGPAFLVGWTEPGASARHAALVQHAREAGWPIYGGAATPERQAGGVDDIGFIVLERGTPDDVIARFHDWILAQAGVGRAYPYRTENENRAS